MNTVDELVGLHVLEARYDGSIIDLNLTESFLRLIPVGDCCANCYIQHVSGAYALQNATIRSVETIESTPTDEEIAAADCLDAWGHRITTDKGVCSIEMRTDHNGYYGGMLQPSAAIEASTKPLLDDF